MTVGNFKITDDLSTTKPSIKLTTFCEFFKIITHGLVVNNYRPIKNITIFNYL
jgi:hypothetical protein